MKAPHKSLITLTAAACALAFSATVSLAEPVDLTTLPPNATVATGQKFAETKKPGVVRVLVTGSGSSHNFPAFFLKMDSETLQAAGFETAATLNSAEALTLLPEADVVVCSGNDGKQWGSKEWQAALMAHADAGKGVVILHAGCWVHPFAEGNYNKRFVAGGSKGHGGGEFEVEVVKPDHPAMAEVPAKFTIKDESYLHNFNEGADYTILANNGKGAKPHASVWVVNDPKTRIVCMTLGHDDKAHSHPAYMKILTNAVKWVSSKN
jgi:type 1 glutamine amidotransferase